ncbi:hypothetical protein EMCRGX_G019128 [Ephydatia muelleri]
MAAGFLALCFVYTLTGIFGSLTVLHTVARIIWSPRRALKKQRREAPPSCLLDASLGTHNYVTANGLKFHYVSAGDDSKPLMLFLHGFPEFWFSWRHQIKEFSRDYHVVAIDMRQGERPTKRSDYSVDVLHKDIVELVPALGYETCVLVAHDWGGVVAWTVAAKNPALVEKLIVMNCPHPRIFAKGRSIGQILKSHYMFTFQLPWLPEFAIRLHDYQAIYDSFQGKKTGVHNKASFPPSLVEAYKYVFSKPGALTGPINYYRSVFTRPSRLPSKPLEMPTLLIWGDDDAALDKKMADMHTSVVSNLTVKHISNCSHWVQQDTPEAVNHYMREFLSS